MSDRVPHPVEHAQALVTTRSLQNPSDRIDQTERTASKDSISNLEPHAMHRATIVMFVLDNVTYISAALKSLLSQWRNDLELLVIDDGSVDGSFDAARATLATHPHVAATLWRNPKPLGLGQLPHVLRQIHTPLIIQADSDDISLPGRIDAILDCFDTDPRCRLVTTNAVLLSEQGIPVGILDDEAPSEVIDGALKSASLVGSTQWIGATAAYHRSLLEDFPPLDAELMPYGLDLLLPFRAGLKGTHHYLAQPYLGWRHHSRNFHKLAGATGETSEAQERHGAFELMALAQKIRDLDTVDSLTPTATTKDTVALICHQTFLRRFTGWCRARNSSTPSRGANPSPSVAPLIALPPITMLQQGRRRFFGTVETFGALAQAWDGMYPPEESYNWIARTAVVTFGWSGTGSASITLGMRSCSPVSTRVRVSVNLEPFHEFEISRDVEAVTLAIGPPSVPGTLSVILHVPDAWRPCDIGMNQDTRLLGAQLEFIEARQAGDHALSVENGGA